jgi:hypothetical protein
MNLTQLRAIPADHIHATGLDAVSAAVADGMSDASQKRWAVVIAGSIASVLVLLASISSAHADDQFVGQGNPFTVTPEQWAEASAYAELRDTMTAQAQQPAKVPVIQPTKALPATHYMVRGSTGVSDAYNWICTVPSDVDQAFALWRGGQSIEDVEATVDCVKLPAGEKAIVMDAIDGAGVGSVDLIKVKLLGTYKNTVGWTSAIGWAN